MVAQPDPDHSRVEILDVQGQARHHFGFRQADPGQQTAQEDQESGFHATAPSSVGDEGALRNFEKQVSVAVSPPGHQDQHQLR